MQDSNRTTSLRNRSIWIAVLALAVVLTIAPPAMAWGPATHVALGQETLNLISMLPAGLAAILSRHRFSYLFGNIAADLVFAKRLSKIKQFCHHWSTGFRILETSPSEAEQAFAWGYLSHLAADTVAHGKFVPYQVLLSDMPVNLGHFYWELRADNCVTQQSWKLLRETLEIEHSSHHESLRTHLTGTFLTHDLNRLLFTRINFLTTRATFRHAVEIHSRHARVPLTGGLVAEYRTECVDRIMSILTEGARSPLLREDPNGTSALMRLSVHNRQTRRLKRQGISTEHRMSEAASSLRPTVRSSEKPLIT